jgi:hypothetical protein
LGRTDWAAWVEGGWSAYNWWGRWGSVTTLWSATVVTATSHWSVRFLPLGLAHLETRLVVVLLRRLLVPRLTTLVLVVPVKSTSLVHVVTTLVPTLVIIGFGIEVLVVVGVDRDYS